MPVTVVMRLSSLVQVPVLALLALALVALRERVPVSRNRPPRRRRWWSRAGPPPGQYARLPDMLLTL
jgi:hypothetical protein